MLHLVHPGCVLCPLSLGGASQFLMGNLLTVNLFYNKTFLKKYHSVVKTHPILPSVTASSPLDTASFTSPAAASCLLFVRKYQFFRPWAFPMPRMLLSPALHCSDFCSSYISPLKCLISTKAFCAVHTPSRSSISSLYSPADFSMCRVLTPVTD